MLTEKLRNLNARVMPSHIFQAPKWIVLGVNNVCNLHCKMCDVGTKNLESNFAQNLVGTKPLHMPEELLFQVIDELAHKFPKTKLGYAFTEPLVYKHLESTLKYANSKNIFTSITTNALTLKKWAKTLSESGLNEINISLDGPQDIHNEIRGNAKSFQNALEGIQELVKYKSRPKIGVYCVITEWNIGYLEQFANIFKDIPIDVMGFMHTNFSPKEIADSHNLLYGNSYPATDSNVDEINIDNYDFDLLWSELKSISENTYPFELEFSPKVETLEKLKMFYQRPDILWGKRCNDVFSNIMVKSDGSIIPAHGRCYNLTVGNLYQNSIQEIWNSSGLGKFRKDLMNAGGLLPACSRCCSAF